MFPASCFTRDIIYVIYAWLWYFIFLFTHLFVQIKHNVIQLTESQKQMEKRSTFLSRENSISSQEWHFKAYQAIDPGRKLFPVEFLFILNWDTLYFLWTLFECFNTEAEASAISLIKVNALPKLKVGNGIKMISGSSPNDTLFLWEISSVKPRQTGVMSTVK